MNEIYIPHFNIQHDWYSELRASQEKVWISCKNKNGVKYGELKYNKNEQSISCSEKIFSAEFIQQHVLKMENFETKATTYVMNPKKTFTKLHKKSINCIDISNGGGLAVTSAHDGNLFIWQTIDGEIRRSLDGHINDVTHCQFFPSGEVILSGGVDMRLKIWAVEDGRCAATLIGHTGAITDTSIIEKGRNFISCSRDGSVRLWDCGTSKCLSVIIDDVSSVINKCCLKEYVSTYGNGGVTRSEREIGSENKVICFACDDGSLYAYDIYSRTKIFCTKSDSPVNCCTFFNDNMIGVGLDDGTINIFDQRNTSSSMYAVRHGESRVCSLKSIYEKKLIIGRGDGTCSIIDPVYSSDPVVIGLTGSDCDPIYDIAVHNNVVYTACRDKYVRKYILDLNT